MIYYFAAFDFCLKSANHTTEICAVMCQVSDSLEIIGN